MTKRRILLILLVALPLLVLTATLLIIANTQKKTTPTKSSAATAWHELSITEVRSVTYYDYAYGYDLVTTSLHLKQDLPEIKAAGFNTIWLILPWKSLEPQPLANPPVYNEVNFTALLDLLQYLKDQKMSALIGLNYFGVGWEPEGIDGCRWTVDETMFNAFVSYANEFLSRIQNHSSNVFIHVFTEGAEPCEYQPIDTPEKARQVAQVLRRTLGALPLRLDPAIRDKFIIGYHDYLIGYNISPGESQSPIDPDNNPFDFVSTPAYYYEDKSSDEITAQLDDIFNRYKAYFPDKPLFLGEWGASTCSFDEVTQERILTAGINFTRANLYGFNLWQWMDIRQWDYCKHKVDDGLGITNFDGSAKKILTTLPATLAPKITETGLNTEDYNPWAVWTLGTNITHSVSVNLYDTDYSLWSANITPTINQTLDGLTFLLPANSPPSKCNALGPCTIYIELQDNVTGLKSGRTILTLPVNTCTPSCEGKQCGDDGCGGSCGSCAENQECVNNSCQLKSEVYDIAPKDSPDGKVNIQDLSLVLANWKWKKEIKDEVADINIDGNVNIADVSLILAHWTKAK